MQKLDFNGSWYFAPVGAPLQPVSVPHDAMILEGRKPENPSGAGCAYFSGGSYEYEKEFTLPNGSAAVLLFEGIYPMGVIYLDGEKTAVQNYGYGECYVDVSRLADGKTHTIHVSVNNQDVPNSRWYSGAGMFRPVWLFTGPEEHILPDGIRVTTLSHDPAVIHVETQHTGGDVTVEILDGETVIATANGDCVDVLLPNAKLWDAEHPNLYTCRATVGEDIAQCRFGIRTLKWSSEGLFINGASVKLKGGCIHHDNGVIGARTFDYSEYRKIKKLKAFGFNAIRSAHNPICRSLLNACDELGMYILDESWDMWYDHKSTHDYASRFQENWEKDLESMVAKDYSHPSVIMYSVGNEVTEPAEEKGIAMTRQLVARMHALDASRPVTAGINPTLMMMRKLSINLFDQGERQESSPAVSSTDFNQQISELGGRMLSGAGREDTDKVTAPCLDTLDIAGYNYATPCYELDAVRHPGRLIVGTETFPQDLPTNWALVKKLPYLYGDFMWTAWDYIGEVGIGAWTYSEDGMCFTKPYPWLLGDTGAFDILGNDNAEAGLASVAWGARKIPYLSVRPVNRDPKKLCRAVWRGTNALPSWAWQGCEGRTAEVEVYSDAAEIELVLNGKSLGRTAVNSGFRADFTIPYTPGILTAVAYDHAGKAVGQSSLRSADGPVSIRILQENAATVGEPVYVDIDLVGENGIVACGADRVLTVKAEGAEVLGFGSANPRTAERFETGAYSTYYGRSLLVILPFQEEVRIKVNAPNLDSAEAVICVKKHK